MRQATFCLLIKDSKILLAMKKRGFGVGRWNGAGGKVEKGEEVIIAIKRETKEEIGIELENFSKFGLLSFRFVNKSEFNQDVHLFVASSWKGDPTESEEMKPKWFSFEEIPYEKMWPDDIYWLPYILKGEKVKASFLFGDGDVVLKHDVKIVKEL